MYKLYALAWWFLVIGSSAEASSLALRFGPPSVGSGGNNPIGIPPSIPDIEFTYLSEGNWETNIAISPGILVGKRSMLPSHVYLSLGGGLVIDANGVGPGVYSGFGVDVGTTSIHFNAELKQAIGIADCGLISPYALRIGASYWF